ncbi:MAG TPA: D-alanyl-D-alanine carboxypeptidase family protein, partial [Candidatus Dormibacteraeota bacterium]|nr:D-alanyl-D-alanine carboxypeptidase family protein [Candidatus Dormibacteraeota bacterium]
TPAAGHPHPLRSDAAPALPPPYSWDYRWLAAHPAAGAPALRARSAILVDLETHRVLYDVAPHASLPMASTTKLMTAMVALDNTTPDSVLGVSAASAHVEPDVMGLTEGEQVPVRDLLYGLLLDSGNDAAETLAEGTLGRESFLAAMNSRARRMGLAETHFANPTGLDDPAQRSSAHDLAIIAATLYQRYPLLEQVVTTKSRSILPTPTHKAFAPMNLDKMLWSYPGAIGFKTGLTDNAGYCLVTGARRGDHTLVAVLLGDPLIFTDGTKLLDYGFARLTVAPSPPVAPGPATGPLLSWLL